MKIINYDDSLKTKIIDFLIEIAVCEFKHDTWLDYFKDKDFSPYKLNTSKFFIAMENDEIIATCGMLMIDSDIVKLNSFYVKSEYRYNGIGKKLFSMAIDFAIKNNYKKIILCTNNDYKLATRFYEKHGFKTYKMEDNYENWMEKII